MKSSWFIGCALLSCLAGCQAQGHAADGAIDDAGDAAAPPLIQGVVNQAYLPTLNSILDGAQSSVRAVQFELNQDPDGDAIVERLAGLAARGVAVHVLLESSVASNQVRVPALVARGVDAKLGSPSRYVHAKLVVVDGTTALLGSTNWSLESMEQNNEASLLVEDPLLVGFFESYAEAVHADPVATPALAPVSTASGTALMDGCYVAQARPMIEAAARRILLVVYGMDASPAYPDSDVRQLIHLMGDAGRRGVDVRVVLEIADYANDVNDLNREAAGVLAAEGIAVRFDPPDRITHAKVLVVDDETIVGSNNWGYGGFQLYHEVGVRSPVSSLVDSMAAYFEAIWASGASP